MTTDEIMALVEAYRTAGGREEHWARQDHLRTAIEALVTDAERYRWLAGYCRSTAEHWGGRWSIVVEGPAPKSHDSEDDFDAAIDAARSKA